MPNLKDYVQLHFIVLIWGFTAILGLLISIPSVELVYYRTFIATVLLAGIVYLRRQSFRLSLSYLLIILGTGVLIGIHWILFFASAKVSTASVCLAGMTTATLWTSFLEPIFFNRRIRFYEIILGLLIIVGLYIIYRFEFNHILGLSLAVLSAFVAALFSVINGHLIVKHNHYVITFYEMMGANLGISVFFLFYGPYFTGGLGLQLIPTATDWFFIFILAGVCTVYAYSIGVKLMKKFSPFAISLTVNLEPVYGILLASIIFGHSERMTWGFYLGTLIILSVVLIYPVLKKYFDKEKKVLTEQGTV